MTLKIVKLGYIMLFSIAVLLLCTYCTQKEKQTKTLSSVMEEDQTEIMSVTNDTSSVLITDKVTSQYITEGDFVKERKEIGLEEDVYIVVEVQPNFPGGQTAMVEFLKENIKYPSEAILSNIQGRVVCNFIVEKNGSLSQVQVIRGVEPSLDKEAIRVIQSMPDWIPGKIKGRNVRVRFTLPVTFRLQENTTTDNKRMIRTESN